MEKNSKKPFSYEIKEENGKKYIYEYGNKGQLEGIFEYYEDVIEEHIGFKLPMLEPNKG